MENEVMNTVLNEVLAEQKEITMQVQSLQDTITVLVARIDHFDKKLDNLKVAAPHVDMQPTQLLISKNMEDIKKVVAQQPKEVVQEKRYLFFPERDAREYYGALFRWIFYGLIATYAFFLLKHMVDNWR